MTRMMLFCFPLFMAAACSVEKNEAPAQQEIDSAVEVTEEVNSKIQEEMAVTGVLEHFPQNVKSPEAWLGHEFKVDDTPIRATVAVPVEALKALVGSSVTIKGTWNPGVSAEIKGDALLESRPQGFEEEARGNGLEASSISETK